MNFNQPRRPADNPTQWPVAAQETAPPVYGPLPPIGPTLTERISEPLRPRRLKKLWHLGGSLIIGFLAYYVLASYTSFTASSLSPGQVIFSNSLIKLWTASYTMAFILANALILIWLFWPELFQFFRPDVTDGPDLATSFRSLPTTHQIWLFVVVFFSLCFLFLGLLSVSPTESVSVGP